MTQPILNKIEVLNEIFTIFSMYFLIYFTDWCGNIDLKSYVGELYMYFVMIIIALNFYLISSEMLG